MSDDQEIYHNPSTICPHCGAAFHCYYTRIPKSRLFYENPEIHTTEHLGPSHAYSCKNCDGQWILILPEPEEGDAS